MSAERSDLNRLSRFVAVGSSGVAANLGTMFVLHDLLGFLPVVAAVCALEASVLWNFELNDRWTFRDFVDSPDSRYRRIVKRFQAAGYLVSVTDEFT